MTAIAAYVFSSAPDSYPGPMPAVAWHAAAERPLLLPVGEHALLQNGDGSIASLGGRGDRVVG